MRLTISRAASHFAAVVVSAVVVSAAGMSAVALSVVVLAQAVNLTGQWTFTVNTDAGPGTPTITLKQDGDKLTGHYSGQLGEADLTGSVKGQEFVFTFSVVAQGAKLDCAYMGTIESRDSLKGTMNIAGLANGTFTAKRQ